MPDNKPEPGKRPGIDRFADVSKALSIAMIPVVLGVGGWVIQREVQQQSLRKEYVALALSILHEQNTDRADKTAADLRSWAVDLLNANSAVRFSDETTKRLKSGEASLPSDFSGRDLSSSLEHRLKTFQSYLIASGFDVEPGHVGYEVVEGDTVDGGNTALYVPERHAMVVAKKYANEADIPLHEFMRCVFRSIRALVPA
jgi:hypothetical protein